MSRNEGIKISVIIPTHNSEKFVEECVRSVMKQTYKNLQIICVDSSSDDTLDILISLQKMDNRLEIIEDPNGSYGHKLNTGIEHAKGDYIAIVESDDYILPETYESLLDGVTATNIDYIKSTGTNHFVDTNGRRIFLPEYNADAESNRNRIINLDKEREAAFFCLPRIWTALYRREFLLENGIVANETPGASFQDTSFTLLVAVLAKTCIYRSGAFYCYRNDNQGSSVKSKSKVFCVCDEYKHIEDILLKQNKWTDSVRKRILRYKLGTYMWNVYRLDEDVAVEFVTGISSEMEEYKEEILNVCTSDEKRMHEMLVDMNLIKATIDERQQAMQQWYNFLCKKNVNRYVLIGAGNIGKTVLWLQEFCDNDFILAIGDNNYLQLKNKIDGYAVKSIEEVVDIYPNEIYLVANKKHCGELVEQLKSLGIREEKIKHLGYLSQMEIFSTFNKWL